MPSETAQDIQINGKNGAAYYGRIYSDKKSTSTLAGKAIVCLTNSSFTDEHWHHHMNSIFNTDDVNSALEHFRNRDDISHLILIPYASITEHYKDHVDNLIRYYLHG